MVAVSAAQPICQADSSVRCVWSRAPEYCQTATAVLVPAMELTAIRHQPAVVLAVIIILGLQTWSHLSGPSKPEAEKIELFSKQFDWTARYSGADNTLGLYDYKLTLDNNELALLTSNTIDSALNNMFNSSTGIRSLQKLLNNRDTIFSDSTLNVLKMDLSRKERLYRLLAQMKANHNRKLDASAWDDFIEKETLVLCEGQEYEISLRSKDVIHSAYFPHMRAQMNAVSPVKISFQDMMIKACAMALRKHPAVNSSWMGEFIRTYNHIHIGSAVAVDQGLIVPVFKFADQKSLSQIASEANGLYDKARTGKLQPQEFTGNTFTISNLGMMDIEDFTAIINPPDSCILAVGRIKEIVIKKADGSFGTTNVMKVTLSCDHRSVDGAIGASFLQTLKKYIENPVTMLV